MRSFIVAALAGLAVAAPAASSSSSYAAASSSSSAAPAASSSAAASGSCMTYSEANQVANNFKAMIDYGKKFPLQLAREALAPGYQDFSDGVNELINQGCSNGPKPLGEVTFASREDFIVGQKNQSTIPFEILTMWYNCDTVIVRWQSNTPETNVTNAPAIGQAYQLVTGIVVLDTEVNPDSSSSQPRLIKTTFSEFNSGAWLIDTKEATSTSSSCPAPVKARSMPMHPALNARK